MYFKKTRLRLQSFCALRLTRDIIRLMAKKVIAFDLDGVIIDKPPLVPKSFLEWMFHGNSGNKLYYRFPRSKAEQLIRRLSHYYLFRPPIQKNLAFINKIASENGYDLYAVSGRYSFLKKETANWLEKRGLSQVFKKVFLNEDDGQPHFFKEKILKELKADIFVDDDEALADYLARKLKTTKVFCFNPRGGQCRNAILVSSLERLLK